MSRIASLGLAFLLIFSGCLGIGDDDTPEEETIEPVGETDLGSLEKDIETLTARLDAEEARVELLENRVDGIDDTPSVLEALGCSDGEIARYTGDEWVCSDDTDTTLGSDEVWNVVSSDFEDIRYNITDIRNKIDGLDMSVFVTNDKHDALAEDVHNLFDSYTEEIANLSNDINNLGIGISSLKKDIDDI